MKKQMGRSVLYAYADKGELGRLGLNPDQAYSLEDLYELIRTAKLRSDVEARLRQYRLGTIDPGEEEQKLLRGLKGEEFVELLDDACLVARISLDNNDTVSEGYWDSIDFAIEDQINERLTGGCWA